MSGYNEQHIASCEVCAKAVSEPPRLFDNDLCHMNIGPGDGWGDDPVVQCPHLAIPGDRVKLCEHHLAGALAAYERIAAQPVVIKMHNGRTGRAGDRYSTYYRASIGLCQFSGCSYIGKLAVDHCHLHGLIRGALCYGHNNLPDERMGDWLLRCPACSKGLLPFPDVCGGDQREARKRRQGRRE